MRPSGHRFRGGDDALEADGRCRVRTTTRSTLSPTVSWLPATSSWTESPVAACGESAPSARPSDVAAGQAGRDVAGSAEIQQVAVGLPGGNSAGRRQDDFRHRLVGPNRPQTVLRRSRLSPWRGVIGHVLSPRGSASSSTAHESTAHEGGVVVPFGWGIGVRCASGLGHHGGWRPGPVFMHHPQHLVDQRCVRGAGRSALPTDLQRPDLSHRLHGVSGAGGDPQWSVSVSIQEYLELRLQLEQAGSAQLSSNVCMHLRHVPAHRGHPVHGYEPLELSRVLRNVAST